MELREFSLSAAKKRKCKKFVKKSATLLIFRHIDGLKAFALMIFREINHFKINFTTFFLIERKIVKANLPSYHAYVASWINLTNFWTFAKSNQEIHLT